ncbi:MAG: 6-carboxytetrahydropterin synthase QueD [Methanotrichaceae archaeon]
MKMGIVTEFDAAHHLPGYDGKCAQIHGHTYTVEVILEGPVDKESGFLMDFYDLKQILKSVLDPLDHCDLNEILPNPTAENIVKYIAERLEIELYDKIACLVSVKLWEGKNKWVMLD